MSGRPSDEKLQSLREMLLIAPFHRWLGLDIVALTADATEWETSARDFAVLTDSLRLAAGPDRAPATGFQGASNAAEGGN